MQLDTLAFQAEGTPPSRKQLFVRISAPDRAAEPTHRPPAWLAVALDVSSSMGGPKLAAALASLEQIIEHADAADRLALVVFDQHARVVLKGEPLGLEAKIRARAAVAQISTGLGTNIEGGYRAALSAMERVSLGIARPRVLLMSDGYASVGAADGATLAARARTAARMGISTSCIGFGDGHDSEVLSAIAAAGDGAYHFVARPADLGPVLASELRFAHAVAATNVHLVLEPSRGVRSASLLHSYPLQSERAAIQVEVGTVARLAPRHLLFRLESDETELGWIRLAWSSPSGVPAGRTSVLVRASADPDRQLLRIAQRESHLLNLARAEAKGWDALLHGDKATARRRLQSAVACVEQMRRGGFASDEELDRHCGRLENAFQVLNGDLGGGGELLASRSFTSQVGSSLNFVDGSYTPPPL